MAWCINGKPIGAVTAKIAGAVKEISVRFTGVWKAPTDQEKMMDGMTKDERLATQRLKRAIVSLPDSLVVYVLDSTVIVCKRGVASDDIQETVGTGFQPCCSLTDLHDGEGCGL